MEEAATIDEAFIALKEASLAIDVILCHISALGSQTCFELANWVRVNRPESEVKLAAGDETAAQTAAELCENGPHLIRVAVARMGIGERTATALAMAVHERATNSVKYEPLSCETGFLDVTSKIEGNDIFVIWAETVGPAIAGSPALKGFGSQLIARSVSGQLGGELSCDWQTSSLFATARMRMDRLAE